MLEHRSYTDIRDNCICDRRTDTPLLHLLSGQFFLAYVIKCEVTFVKSHGAELGYNFRVRPGLEDPGNP